MGKIDPFGIGVRVAMKGYMSHIGDYYNFKMHGRTIPLRGSLIKNRIRNHLDNQIKGNDPVSAKRVTPNADSV
jgi:hypothetical protein